MSAVIGCGIAAAVFCFLWAKTEHKEPWPLALVAIVFGVMAAVAGFLA